MTKFLAFTIDQQVEMETAWHELEMLGFTPLWSDEQDNACTIFCEWQNNISTDLPHWISSNETTEYGEIDWAEQWQLHGQNWQDGFLLIDIPQSHQAPAAKTIKLQPGPGFGDLSHPTTQLVLAALNENVKDAIFIDVGSGSGILTFAAIALGAKKGIGIDIDSAAIDHAHANALLNGMQSNAYFYLADELHLDVNTQSEKIVVAMNMISSEQKVAWQSVAAYSQYFTYLITSGIRAEEKDEYAQLLTSWNWRIDNITEQDQWLCFSCVK